MPALLATLVEGRRFEAWDVHASEWHLLQAQPRIPTGRALSPDPKPEPEPEPEPEPCA